MTSTNPNTIKLGGYIVIAGLALQALSFGVFILLVYHAYRSLKRDGMKPYEAPWGKILKILFFSSGCFLVRRLLSLVGEEIFRSLNNAYRYDASIAPSKLVMALATAISRITKVGMAHKCLNSIYVTEKLFPFFQRSFMFSIRSHCSSASLRTLFTGRVDTSSRPSILRRTR